MLAGEAGELAKLTGTVPKRAGGTRATRTQQTARACEDSQTRSTLLP